MDSIMDKVSKMTGVLWGNYYEACRNFPQKTLWKSLQRGITKQDTATSAATSYKIK